MLLGHADDLDRAVNAGLLCSECGCQFVKEHGHPVACHYCYALLSFHDRTQTHKSTHKEQNRAAHEAEGKARKQARMARNVERG